MPSRNRKTGRYTLYLSPEAKIYRWKVKGLSTQWKKLYDLPLRGPLFAQITLTPPTRRVFDIDNRYKVSFDALKDSGFFTDDSIIEKKFTEKNPPQSPGKIEISFTQLEEWPLNKCLLCKETKPG